MRTIEDILREQRFFAELDASHQALIAGCASNRACDAGAYLFREGGDADAFFVIRHGHVALDIAVPGREPLVIATLGPGDVVGASWLIAPYRWRFGARAIEPARLVQIDARCLRAKLDADHDFGYAMMSRFVPLLAERLQATRLQLLDVYGRG